MACTFTPQERTRLTFPGRTTLRAMALSVLIPLAVLVKAIATALVAARAVGGNAVGMADSRDTRPETTMPGVAAPGIEPSTRPERKAPMSSVARITTASTPRPGRIGDAQLRAMIRWHFNKGQGPIIALRQTYPRWPLIECNATARAYAPLRGGPTHAA